MAMPARAQSIGVAATVSLQSNQTFRGETISRDGPGATLAVNADGPLGLFAGADVSVALASGAVRMTANAQFAGVAVRAGGVGTVELGGVHRHYREVFDSDYDRDYSEIFVGVSRGATRLRGYLSPDYVADHAWSGYIELETRLLGRGAWSLHGHGGLRLVPQDAHATTGFPRVYEDWSLSLGREWRGFNLALGVAGTNYPVIGDSGRARVQFVIAKSL